MEEARELNQEKAVSRRAFLGGMASLAAATALTAGCANQAPEAAPAESEPKEPEVPAETPAGSDLAATGEMSYDEGLALLKQEPEVVNDLVLSDGTVIPALYVRVRNRINRLGAGIGNVKEFDVNHWAFAMRAFSEDEAELYLQMPLTKDFLAAELAEISGRDEKECEETLEAMSKRGLLYRTRRGGGAYYRLIPQINGIWEYSINIWGEDGKFDPDYLTDHWAQMGDFGADAMNSKYPPYFRTIPVSAEVTGDKQIISPFDDYEAILRRHDVIARGDCVCRANARVLGVSPNGLPLDDICQMDKYKSTEILTGQEAEYYIENGIGWPITADEAISVIKEAVEDGLVIEVTRSKAGEIFCCCHGDSCGMLGVVKAAGGGRAVKYYSRYNLDHDKDTCLKCGLCATRCNLDAITYDDDGFPVTNTDLCVRCGQCAVTCPAEARVLNLMGDDYPELAETIVENDLIKAVERMQLGLIEDVVPEA